MDYVDHVFTDETVHLDDNTFTRCTFENCVIHYDGGETTLSEQTSFKTRNRLKFGPNVNPFDNPISQALIDAVSATGGDHNAAPQDGVS